MADHATLARLSAEAGLPEDDVHEVLTSDRHADAVREDQRAATALGVTGVPCFLVDGKFGTTGAQPPEALWMLLEHGWQEH
jgi:predicted DsbA family dithiol-disulfide isomerase